MHLTAALIDTNQTSVNWDDRQCKYLLREINRRRAYRIIDLETQLLSLADCITRRLIVNLAELADFTLTTVRTLHVL